MGKERDFSAFTKSGHVLYRIFLCCLFLFESIREKPVYVKISHSTLYSEHFSPFFSIEKLSQLA